MILILFVPPIQAHSDVVIFSEVLDNNNELVFKKQDYKNDSQENKNTKHHHRCSVESTISSFIQDEINIFFHKYSNRNETILFYEKMISTNTLDILEEPPRF
ncbi:hypothetical protein [Polaribacter uvawellassae]|uniref:hypothetical protein n=1 Tax=Polaribacter uvawellassae TaxID=3133495 RepID=UPI00321A4114